MDQTGGTNLPRFNAGWAGEQALDVDAVSAICPDCKILVVQAKSASIADLGTAVNTAAKQAGVVAISNSYGGGDLSDATYGANYNHPGIAVTASTGDNGYQGGSFPASSHVRHRGRRHLADRGVRTPAAGPSPPGAAPARAARRSTPRSPRPPSSDTGCAKRAMADVSAAADPTNGGMAVYYPTSAPSLDLGAGRRHQRVGADHRLGLRAVAATRRATPTRSPTATRRTCST